LILTARTYRRVRRYHASKWTAAQRAELPEGPPHGGPSFVHGPRGPDSNRHLRRGQRRALPVELPRGRTRGVAPRQLGRKMSELDSLARVNSLGPASANDARPEVCVT